jgi:hypothetical protein
MALKCKFNIQLTLGVDEARLEGAAIKKSLPTPAIASFFRECRGQAPGSQRDPCPGAHSLYTLHLGLLYSVLSYNRKQFTPASFFCCLMQIYGFVMVVHNLQSSSQQKQTLLRSGPGANAHKLGMAEIAVMEKTSGVAMQPVITWPTIITPVPSTVFSNS